MTAKDNSIQSSLLDGNDQQSTVSSDITEHQQQLPPDYTTSTIQENEPSDDDNDDDDDEEESLTQIDDNDIYDENGQIKFPLNDLIKLEEQLNQTRWVVPVLPDGELIECLRASVRLASQSKYLLNNKKLKFFFFPSFI